MQSFDSAPDRSPSRQRYLIRETLRDAWLEIQTLENERRARSMPPISEENKMAVEVETVYGKPDNQFGVQLACVLVSVAESGTSQSSFRSTEFIEQFERDIKLGNYAIQREWDSPRSTIVSNHFDFYVEGERSALYRVMQHYIQMMTRLGASNIEPRIEAAETPFRESLRYRKDIFERSVELALAHPSLLLPVTRDHSVTEAIKLFDQATRMLIPEASTYSTLREKAASAHRLFLRTFGAILTEERLLPEGPENHFEELLNSFLASLNRERPVEEPVEDIGRIYG